MERSDPLKGVSEEARPSEGVSGEESPDRMRW